MPVFFYSVVQKWVFTPQGQHVVPTNVKFGTEERTAKFHVYRVRIVGIQPPKLSKFRILARNLYLRGESFAIFLRNFQRLYASIGTIAFKFLVWSLWKGHFFGHVVGHFSHKFSIVLAAKLLIGSKKLGGAKWEVPPLSPCQVWWGSLVARWLYTKKCDFIVCLSVFVTL